MHLRGNECAERRNEGSRAAFLESALDDRGINVKPKSEEKIKREKEREREKKEEKKRTQRDNEMSVSSRPEPVGRTSGRYADYSHHSQNRSLATRLLEAGSI